jgi:hypothetical protein
MDIINTDKGTYDLSTNEGRYKYVTEFMVSKGVSGNLLSCLEKLFTQAEKSEDLKEQNTRLREALEYIAHANWKDHPEISDAIDGGYLDDVYSERARAALEGK